MMFGLDRDWMGLENGVEGTLLGFSCREERYLKFGKLAMLDDLRVELQVWIGLTERVEFEWKYSSIYPLSRGGINYPLLISHR